MNKLAVLAFAILIFLSSMLWYLANGSLNEYLKSQIELQGSYYSGQKATIELADFSSNTGTGEFQDFRLLNLDGYQTDHAIIIDVAHLALVQPTAQPLLTTVKELTINKLTLNSEAFSGEKSNVDQLIHKISNQLANDYPELYPNISARIYAKNNPQLNAEEYAQNHPQAGPTKAHSKPKKKRGKSKGKINITSIKINIVELNIIDNGLVKNKSFRDVNIAVIGGKEGVVTNQLGGEVLLALLKLAVQ